MEPRWTVCRLQFIGRHVVDAHRRRRETTTVDWKQGSPVAVIVYVGWQTAGLFRIEARWWSHPDRAVRRRLRGIARQQAGDVPTNVIGTAFPDVLAGWTMAGLCGCGVRQL